MKAIVRKDLTHHGPLLLFGAGLSMVALIGLVSARLLVAGRVVLDGDAVVGAYADFVTWVLTPYALVLGRQLALPELRVGLPTLRRLPVSLPVIYLSKLVVAVSLLTALTACGLGLIASLLRLGGPLDRPLLVGLVLGSLAWQALALTLALAWASLGRQRHPALAVAAVVWWGSGGWWAPAELVASGFFDPRAATHVAWAAAGAAGAGFALWVAYGRYGAGWCQGPLRRRERVVVVALLLAGAAQLRPRSAPPGLAGRTVQVEQVTVRQLADGGRARAVAEHAAAVAAQVAQRVGLPPASLAIEHGPGFGARRQRAVGVGADGVLVRIDLEATLDAPGLRGWWAAGLLDASTGGRLQPAPWRLLLDGYADWFEAPSDPRTPLRVAWAAQRLDRLGLLGPSLLERWGAVRAALGDPLARALAGWLLTQVAAETAPARVDALIAAAAQARARPLLGLGDASLRSLVATHTGRRWASLAAGLAQRARALAAAHADALAPLAAPVTGDVTPQLQGDALRLAFRAPGRARLIHALADDDPAPPHYHGDEGDASAGPLLSHVSYPEGARLRVAFATWSPELGCDMISGWRPLELP